MVHEASCRPVTVPVRCYVWEKGGSWEMEAARISSRFSSLMRMKRHGPSSVFNLARSGVPLPVAPAHLRSLDEIGDGVWSLRRRGKVPVWGITVRYRKVPKYLPRKLPARCPQLYAIQSFTSCSWLGRTAAVYPKPSTRGGQSNWPDLL